ncbi:hypothetical protein [Halorussus ruber]|uniref:hypothetical protein n=1 Tax=Halorussus ruber TaxID=1126238 RepID=UPI00109228A9|nr:hypothetical protein [Halorussus ruber]
MKEDDEQDDLDVRASVDSFRRAGVAASDGLGRLYEAGRMWLGRRHSLVRFVAATAIWFVGNWTYNRIASPIIGTATKILGQISSELAVTPAVAFLEGNPIFASLQLLVILIAVVVAQNRRHTQKLKDSEDKLTNMTNGSEEITDGGSRKLPPTGPRAIGGLIAGGAIGLSFGPGGVLAGMFLGFAWGDKLDIRAYERNPNTPELNRESNTEQ